MSQPAETAVREGADARHAARSGAVQILTTVTQAFLATTQIVFARLYGRPVYGSYLSALAVLEVLSRGGPGGADKAMLRFVAAARVAGDAQRVRSAIASGLRLNLIVGGTFMLGLILGAPRVAALLGEPSLAAALRILAPLPWLTGMVWILIQASLAARTTKANFYVRGLVDPSLLLVGGVLAWWLGGGLRALTAAHTTTAALTLVVAAVVVRRLLPPEETTHLWRTSRVAGFARFSLPIGAAEMLNAILQRADIVILTRLKGVEAAAVYGAADLLTRSIANIRYAFDSIVAGVLSETLHLGEMDRLQYNLRLVTRWVVSAAAPIAVAVLVLRHDLLRLFGTSYASGANVMLALGASYFLYAALGLTGWVLVVAGYARISLANNLIGAAFNVPAAYLLIKRFGALGAGCASLGTAFLTQALILGEVAVLSKVHPLSVELWKPLCAAVAAAAVMVALRPLFGSAWIRVAVTIGAGAAAYLAALVALGLPPEERRIFARLGGRSG